MTSWGEESDRKRREWMQASAAEVPGFAARTTMDDMIGKLFALRQRLREPVPDELGGLLDDADALVERAVDLGLDPDSEEIEGCGLPLTPSWPDKSWSPRLSPSGSEAIYFCSCGTPGISGSPDSD